MASSRREQDEADTQWVDSMLRSARSKKFHGSLIFIFQDGDIQRLKVEQVHLPPSKCNTGRRPRSQRPF